MALSEKLQFLITANGTDAISGFRAVGSAAESELGKAESKLDQVGGKLQSGGAAALAFAGVATVGLTKIAGASSDLNEAMSLSQQVFDEAGAEVQTFAKGAAQALGQSETAALNATNSFGFLLQNLGFTTQESANLSVELTTLASDLGSAFNKDPAVAVEALGSALRGESEPIRQFGVVINDAGIKAKALELGLYSGVGALDASAKASATLALITEQTAKAQGDFARTADGQANSARIAKAELENAAASLGQGFLPILTKITSGVGSLASGFVNLPDPIKNATGSVLAFGTIGIGALGAVSFAAGSIIKMRDNIKSLASALGSAGPAFLAVTAAVGAGALIYNEFTKDSRRAAEQAKEFATALRESADITDVITENIARLAETFEKVGTTLEDAAAAVRGTKEEFDSYKTAIELATVAEEGFITAHFVGAALEEQRAALIKATAQEVNNYTTATDAATKADFDAAASATLSAEEYARLSAALEDNVLMTGELEDANLDLASTISQAIANTEKREAAEAKVVEAIRISAEAIRDRQSAEEVANEAVVTGIGLVAEQVVTVDNVTAALQAEEEALRAEVDALNASADAIRDKIDAQRSAADSTFAVAEAGRDWTEALEALDGTLAEVEASEVSGEQKTRDIERAYADATRTAADLADANVTLAQESATAQGKTLGQAAATDIWNGQMLGAAATANGPLRQSIIDYVAEVNGIPPEKVSEILALIDQGKLAEAQAALNDASATREAAIVADAQTADAKRELDELTVRRSVQIVANVIAGKLATGGDVGVRRAATGADGGGFFEVGEQGKELVALPNGSHVFSAGESSAIRNGNGRRQGDVNIQNVNLYNPVDVDLFARRILFAMAIAG